MLRTQGYFCTILCQNMALKIHEPRHFPFLALNLHRDIIQIVTKLKVTQLKIENMLVKDKEIAHSN